MSTLAAENEGPPLPEGWRWVPLGSVVKRLKAGGTPRRGVIGYWGGDIPFVKIEDLTLGGRNVISTEETITEEGLNNSSAWIVQSGAVLLAMYASIGTVGINRVPVATNQAIIAVQPDPDTLDAEYLYHALRHSAKRLASYNVQKLKGM